MTLEAELARLDEHIGEATGPSKEIDQLIASAFHESNEVAFSASVDACLALIGRALPEWHWHVGHGPKGILPYASMASDNSSQRVEMVAPTVPLALLGCLVKVLNSSPKSGHPS